MDAGVPQVSARRPRAARDRARRGRGLRVRPPRIVCADLDGHLHVDEIDQALRMAEEIVLVTRGRKTGRAHVATVWFAYEDGAVWLRTDRETDWYRNLRRDPHVTLRVAGAEIAATNEPIADASTALRHVVDLFRAKYGVEWVSDWYVERGRAPVRLRLER